MRILHLFNTAGIASILAKYQRKLLNHNAVVYTVKRGDPFGFKEVYPSTKYFVPELPHVVGGGLLLLSLPFEIAHVHMSDILFYRLKKFVPFGKKILHYHGSDIRNNWSKRQKYWSEASVILVSTEDLLNDAPNKAQYLPNPIDTELFSNLGLRRRQKGLLIVKYRRSHMWQHIKPIADRIKRDFAVDYDTVFCDLSYIPYKDMPALLNQYEWFFDIQHGFTENEKIIPALSTTGLQALACGCKVITSWSEVITMLPEKHRPENIVRKLDKIYRNL